MRKRITKRNWYDDELENGKAKAPIIAPNDESHLDGLNEGEIQINNNSEDPTIFIRDNKGKIIGFKPNAGADIEELKKLFLSKTSPDSTPHLLSLLGGLGLGKNNKRINDLIRYYDEVDKEDDDKAVPTDADIYSALMTDQRIEEEIGEMDDRFIRKDKKDVAHKHILFEEGITVYELAQMMNIDVKQLATIAQAVCQILRSDRFVDGFSGEGYQIWKDIATGDWSMTLDRLTVRKAMTIYELIIQKIRAVGGMMVVSAANGKVKIVQKVGSNYVFTFEDENMFVGSDLARCQVFTGKDVKYYWVKVSSVSDHRVIVPEAEFAGVVPEVGDEWVLMGNTDNKRRQNFILISATEDGQPRFDCYNGVKTKNFEGCLKVRVGNLDGIKDSRFPADLQPNGDGLYGNNCFLTGVFVLVNGKDVMTMFQITEGLIKSEIASVRSEINQKDNYLSNSSFMDSMTGWTGSNRVSVFSVNEKLLMFNGNLYANKERFANIVDQGNKSVLRIKNSSVSQSNSDLTKHPEFKYYPQYNEDGSPMDKPSTPVLDEEGNPVLDKDGNPVMNVGNQIELKRPRMFYISFKYMVRRAGALNVYFRDEQIAEEGKESDFEKYEKIDYSESLYPGEEFKTMEIAGKWNGMGDFVLSFTGDIYIHSIALADNPLADMEERFSTKFEQTDRMIKLSADEIRENGKKTEEYHSEFLVTARNIRAELSEGLDNLEDSITEAYKGYVNITARDLTIGYTADISDSETKITEAYTGAISISAKGLEAKFTTDITDMEEGITSAYKGYFDLTAEGLVSGFDKKLVDLKTGITSEYKGYFEMTSEKLESGFNKKIEGINGILIEHDSKFNVTAEKISALVTSTNDIDNTIKSSGWITTAEGNTLWASKNGIISAINQTAESISIDASKINLNGLVTANEYFKILLDGSIEANKGTFNNVEIKNGSRIGNLTVYNDFLRYDDGKYYVALGNGVLPLTRCAFYLEDKNREWGTRKVLAIFNSLPSTNTATFGDVRDSNVAISIPNGTLKINPGNLMDVPGVILAGRISENGIVEYQYGRKGRGRLNSGYAFAVEGDTGNYQITHCLGHKNYTVLITPHRPGSTWNKTIAILNYLENDYFTVFFNDAGTGNTHAPSAFSFVVIGENTE